METSGLTLHSCFSREGAVPKLGPDLPASNGMLFDGPTAMRRRYVRAAAICSLFALWGLGAMPTAAPASVTLGQTCSPNATSQITAIQTATAPGVPAASAPFTGVITSFSVYRDPTEAFQSRLKVLHENGAGSFTAVANGPLATLNPGLNVIPARVTIAAGDFIGTWGDPGTQRCNFVPLENRMESLSGPEPQPPEPFSTNAFNGVIVDLSAQLEPDADRDGFGDETQDGCPSSAKSQGACPKKKCKKKAKKRVAEAKKKQKKKCKKKKKKKK